MSYKSRYIQYLQLPNVPDYLIKNLQNKFGDYQAKSEYKNYVWSDTFNEEINAWCKEKICDDMYWGFQIIKGDLDKHKDQGTKTKLIYLIENGGEQVYTRFWKDDGETLLDEYIIDTHRWHILKADSMHSVENMRSGAVRFSITGRIF